MCGLCPCVRLKRPVDTIELMPTPPLRRRLGGADHQDVRALPVRPSEPTGRHDRAHFETASKARAQRVVTVTFAAKISDFFWVDAVALPQLKTRWPGESVEI